MFPFASLKIELLAFLTVLAQGFDLKFKYLKLVQNHYKCIEQLQKQVLGFLWFSR